MNTVSLGSQERNSFQRWFHRENSTAHWFYWFYFLLLEPMSRSCLHSLIHSGTSCPVCLLYFLLVFLHRLCFTVHDVASVALPEDA